MNSYYNVLPTVFSLSRSPSPLFPPYMYVFIFTWGGGRARQLDEGNNTKGCDALGAQECAFILITGGTFLQLHTARLKNGASTAASPAYNLFQQCKQLHAFSTWSFHIQGQYLQFGFLQVPINIGTHLSLSGWLIGLLSLPASLCFPSTTTSALVSN